MFPVSIIAVRLERDGASNGSVVVFQDITERRRVQRELEESEQSSQHCAQRFLDGHVGLRSDHRSRHLQSTPGSACWATSRARARKTAISSCRSCIPRIADDISRRWSSTCAGETVAVEVEFRMRRADGEWAWIRSIGKIIERDAAGRPARSIGIHIDTTAAHQIQSELADAKDAAVSASQAKSEFLATMSHEIRTPMNAIIGLSHLFARTELIPRQRDYLTKIQNAAQALLAIINDILDFSKIEAGKLTIEVRRTSSSTRCWRAS